MSAAPDAPTGGLEAALAEQLAHSGLFDAGWYLRRYPDVARGRLDPWMHFLRIGHSLGRAPGPMFCPHAYRVAHPDVASADVDPLCHYLTRGRAEGRALYPSHALRQSRAAHLRSLLETGGLEQGPLQALTALAEADPPDPEARRTLALRALDRNRPSEALHWFTGLGPALAPLRLVAAARAGEANLARRIREDMPGNGDMDLAATHIYTAPSARLACLNAALTRTGLVPMTLGDGEASPLDRLESAAPLPQAGTGGPLVSVILAAQDAEETLATALASILGQSWRTLELIVVDDASSDATPKVAAEWAERDPRLTLIRLPRNAGAYGARNVGLAAARGTYVTLQDADDWSHPERLARQVSFLESHCGFAGCLSLQARVDSALAVSRWTGEGRILHENMTSLMLSRALVSETLGGWDPLRVSADSELLRRVRRLYGAGSVPELPEGPLALQRDHGGNATTDSATGMGWFYYGARQEYHEAQLAHHRSARSLRYDPDGPRPFPAPAILQPAFDRATVQTFEHVYAGVLSVADDSMDTLLGWLDEDRATGRRAALVPLYDIAAPWGGDLAVHPVLRARIDGQSLCVLCYGEEARCQRFRLLPGQRPPAPHRYVPRVREGTELVLAPAAPAPKVNDR